MKLFVHNPSAGESYAPGVFIKEAKIKGIQWSTYESEYPKDIDLVIDYEADGYDKKLFIKGNLWGKAKDQVPVNISFFLSALGIMDEMDDDEINDMLVGFEKQQVSPILVRLATNGRQIKVLEYVSTLYEGKPSYRTWDGRQRDKFRSLVNVFDLTVDNQVIADTFLKEVRLHQEAGYPIPYDPSLLSNPSNASTLTANDIPDEPQFAM